MNFAVKLASKALTLVIIIFFSINAKAFEKGTVQLINSKYETYSFFIEIADTPALRSKGLMFRDTVRANHGMLFDFKTPTIARMWMKNTIISLDMLFISQDGRIGSIISNTVPFSEEVLSSKKPVRWVLELNNGITEQYNINVGDQMIADKNASTNDYPTQ